MEQLAVRRVPQIICYRLEVKPGVRVPKKNRTLYAKTTEEALEEAAKVLKITGSITPKRFAARGGKSISLDNEEKTIVFPDKRKNARRGC